MNDHRRRELVNSLTDIAKKYAASGQLRERIAEVLVMAIDESATAERERCAQIAEGMEQDRHWVPNSLYANIRQETAALIRRQKN